MMRKLLGAALAAAVALSVMPVSAADLFYPEPEYDVPDVDYGLGGSFYLRGSVGLNGWWARDFRFRDCPDTCGEPFEVVTSEVTESGFGYSFGAGFGYETGDGLRADVTIDRLHIDGITDGDYEVSLRSTLALANAYLDFPLSAGAAGGFGAYVGAGFGAAYNDLSSTGPNPGPDGGSWTAAGAVMAGVTYDMGALVADLGYRGIYMPQLTNGDAALEGPALSPYYIDNNFIHEVRGTMRYRMQ
ncbi:hypothetical protein EMQ25_01510 [Arsenicitalea aurantiaca]|uniref:Porin family protein n=1 Tax=Arsenicitalea aurantiaca TaxID=1783274 RepID=A0A433XKR3_9HYPH|nr:hypothetical protein [Arsenicitalea aurantiaca]RUT34666.1 hypothetical protein EMQ25_01510 [Arsenicitalea aurantiaca]